jgi:hypothetical protein
MFKPKFTPCGEDPQGRRNPLRRATPLARYAHLSDTIVCARRDPRVHVTTRRRKPVSLSLIWITMFNTMYRTRSIFSQTPATFYRYGTALGEKASRNRLWCYFCGTGGRGVSGRDGRTRAPNRTCAAAPLDGAPGCARAQVRTVWPPCRPARAEPLRTARAGYVCCIWSSARHVR